MLLGWCFSVESWLVSQEILTPEKWECEEKESLHIVTLIEKPKKEVASEGGELELYQKLVSSSEEKHLCRQFLQKYPDSPLRYQVINLARSASHKNIQAYTVGSATFLPQESPTILLTGSRVKDVTIQIWKVDLQRTIRESLPIHFTRISRNAIKIKEWVEKGSISAKRLVLSPLPAGLYILTAIEEDVRTELAIVVSEISMLVKRSEDMVLVWVGRRHGQPLHMQKMKKASLYILHNDQIIHETHTTPQGLWAARVKNNLSPLTFVAFCGEQIALLDSHWYLYERALHRCYIYLDRPFYFPTETIHAKIFLRRLDLSRQKYIMDSKAEISVDLQDDTWHRLATQTVKVTDMGTASFSYSLPKNARPGQYCLRIRGWCMAEKYFPVFSPNSTDIAKNSSQDVPPQETIPVSPVSESAPGMKIAKDTYEIGEDFSLSLTAGETPVLLTYEGGTLLGYHLLAPCPPGTVVKKKITRSFSPAIKVVAHRFCKHELLSIQKALSVPARDQLLLISAQTKQSARGEIGLEIAVTDHNQKPLVAELMISIVPDVFPASDTSLENFYYGQRYSDLPTDDSFQFEFISDRESSFLTVDHPPKTSSIPPKKQKAEKSPRPLSLASYWNGFLLSNPNGKASVQFSLPGSSHPWRIVILAIDQETRVGHAMFRRSKGFGKE
jgi:hypothetical protein